MRFFAFIFRNISRRPLRSALTAFSMAIGVGAVVSLVGVSSRFERNFVQMYEELGIDLIAVRKGQAHRGQSVLPESLVERVRNLPHVKEIIPGLVDVVSYEPDLPIVPVQGLVPETLIFEHLKIVSGRPLRRDDKKGLLLGSLLADNLGIKRDEVDQGTARLDLTPGDSYAVVGIFESFNFSENGTIVLNIRDLQASMGREDQVTGISVLVENPSDSAQVEEVRHAVQALEPNLQVMKAREHVESLTEVKLAKAMAWLTSTVALIIGAVGMVNTMVMSVNERVEEIGILRAIGWRKPRVVQMIVSEAMMLSGVGGILGSLGSMLLLRVLTRLPMVQSLIDGHIEPSVVMYGMVIALTVGALGGALPAIRASQLAPTTALRYQ